MANIIEQNPNWARQLLGDSQQSSKAQASQGHGLGVSLKAPEQDTASISAMSSSRAMSAAMAYSETLSISMTTQEGDEVSVDFRQLYAQYQSYKEMQQAEQDSETGAVRYFESREAMEANAFEENFAFSVQGDLNEAELTAVFDVFEQVDKLANKFFDGNIEQALQQAQNLNVDFSQLQSLSLKVSQTAAASVSTQQAAAYGSTQGASGDNIAQMQALPEYLQRWQEAINRLETLFQDSQQAFDDLMSGALEQRFPEQDSRQGWLERVQSFHEGLLELAQQNRLDAEGEEVEEDVTSAATESAVEQSEEAQPTEQPVVNSDVDAEPDAMANASVDIKV